MKLFNSIVLFAGLFALTSAQDGGTDTTTDETTTTDATTSTESTEPDYAAIVAEQLALPIDLRSCDYESVIDGALFTKARLRAPKSG